MTNVIAIRVNGDNFTYLHPCGGNRAIRRRSRRRLRRAAGPQGARAVT